MPLFRRSYICLLRQVHACVHTTVYCSAVALRACDRATSTSRSDLPKLKMTVFLSLCLACLGAVTVKKRNVCFSIPPFHCLPRQSWAARRRVFGISNCVVTPGMFTNPPLPWEGGADTCPCVFLVLFLCFLLAFPGRHFDILTCFTLTATFTESLMSAKGHFWLLNSVRQNSAVGEMIYKWTETAESWRVSKMVQSHLEISTCPGMTLPHPEDPAVFQVCLMA